MIPLGVKNFWTRILNYKKKKKKKKKELFMTFKQLNGQ